MRPQYIVLGAGEVRVVPLDTNNDGFDVAVRAPGAVVELTVDNVWEPQRVIQWFPLALDIAGVGRTNRVISAFRITAGPAITAVVLQDEVLRAGTPEVAAPPATGALTASSSPSNPTISQLMFVSAVRAVSYQYRINGGAPQVLATNRIITGLVANTTYSIEVRGVNSGGFGPWSNVYVLSTPLANGTVLGGEQAAITTPANTLVAFGAGSSWTYNYLTGNSICNGDYFASVDPAPGVAKSCVVGPYTAPGANYVLAALFANNDQGVVLDFTDLTDEKLAWVKANPGATGSQFLTAFPNHSLFKESTFTTPVMALEDPIGGVKDMRFGGQTAGNNAIQPTTGDRLVASARVNWYLNTAWTGGGNQPTGWVMAAGTTSGTNVPNGTINGNVIYRQTAVAQRPFLQTLTTPTLAVGQIMSNTIHVGTIYSGTNLTLGQVANWVNVSGTCTQAYYVDGVLDNTVGAAPLTANTKVTVVATCTGAGTLQPRVGLGVGAAMTGDVDFSRPMLTAGGISALPRYQLVNTATDYDAVGFPKGARFNGVNSWMYIPNLPMSGSERALIMASVTRLSDATTGIIAELGTNSATVNGTFALMAPSANGAASNALRARGNAGTATVDVAVPAAPRATILTGLIDLAAQTLALRRDGVQIGGGTFGALGQTLLSDAPFYIGREGGTSLPANMLLHKLVVRGSYGDPFRLSLAETFGNDPVQTLP